MLVRQYRKTLADVVQLLNFVQDGFNRHKRHSLGLRRRAWSSVWREKVEATPPPRPTNTAVFYAATSSRFWKVEVTTSEV